MQEHNHSQKHSEKTMRKLKFAEKKLLKKVNFLDWKREGNHREAQVIQRYHVTGRDDYKKYSSLCRMVQKLVSILKQIDPRDPFRIEMTDMLLEKLYNMGVLATRKSLALCDRLSVSSFCRRRLSTVLVRLKFAEHLKEAVTYIEQGHIRVGPETITDPAFLVTRNMEDFITWVDSSKIKRKMLEYNEKLDDYDAMN
ncbi:Ribosomal_S4 domain-containing protein/S4 domain-containing protein [Cephalotus follicularis]|uniref:U3 small nucleolar ribonucleoprotein protein IMP3 n=1 Tax=Cephalotus follicularis TaxID=3775 RepID=A0A1Q3AWK6_CEPFO|nr:Ribosomal_S4 domain-containing protein/S4 domain-containing protein [Cephalotus follicularis]